MLTIDRPHRRNAAGADLKEIASFAPRLMSEEGPFGFTRLTPSKPAIAAIGGWWLAAGLELALWCDLRIAAEGSQLGVPAGAHFTRALKYAEALAAFPQETMLADRAAALDGLGLTLADGLAREALAGPEVFAVAVRGAVRFAGGEGRGGSGAGV